MMQTLLRDRFKLTFHSEKRELPTYALVVARSDGRSALDSTGFRTANVRRQAHVAALPGWRPAYGPAISARPECPAVWLDRFGPGRLLAHGVPIDMLAQSIGNLPAITAFKPIVVNETKLEGLYDFDFKWTNEFAARRTASGRATPAPAPGDEPTLVTALQEQLGLKLDARRATVDVLVIDSIEKPTEN